MASAPDSQSNSSSKKKSKKKSKNTPIVTTQNTITYGHPVPISSYPAMPVVTGQQPLPPGVVYPVQPGVYPVRPGVYPVYPGQPIVLQGHIPGAVPVTAGPILTQGQPSVPPSPPGGQPQRQLEFNQAMADFQKMFPSMDREVIETVLRSNNGKVDETIDQLLTLSESQAPSRPTSQHGLVPIPPSQLPPEMISPAFSAEPPPYSPPEPNSIFSRYNTSASSGTTTTLTTSSPLARRDTAPPATFGTSGPTYESTVVSSPPRLPAPRLSSSELNTSRQWNPPVIGDLPNDFLRLSMSDAASPPPPSQPPPQPPQPRVARGIQERLDRNSIRQQSINQHDVESAQMLEDERIALMLQNEEFLRQLQRNPEFISALERDYQDALRDDAQDNEINHRSAIQPPRPAQPPTRRPMTTPPNMATRPLPSTPGPELPARPLHLRHDSSSSSLPATAAVSGVPGGSTTTVDGISPEDVEFRNKLNHMGKSSKTKLSSLAGMFNKKKKSSKKYESGSGATDALLDEGIYEELNENSPLTNTERSADANLYHEDSAC